MIADIHITEKSFGPKILMTGVKFSVDDGEKVGLIGRNGVGKSTLFGILAGVDADYTGEVIFRRGSVVVATAQEHHDLGEQTVLDYVLGGLPEYGDLKKIIDEYPLTMGDNMRLIAKYTDALARFEQKGFYQIEQKIERELEQFQLAGFASRPMRTLSGGQKRLIEIVKIMHAQAHLALIDEPTNHMDYAAKQQFIDWMRGSETGQMAMLIITHDRDVLARVDRIIEIKDGQAVSYRGNYDDYLRQNTNVTNTRMHEYEITQAQIENLKKRVQFARSKKASWGGTADKRNPFVVMEAKALKEIKELQKIEKPSFWIDKESASQLDYKAADRYDKYKARNIKLHVKTNEKASTRCLVRVEDLALGYGEKILFEGVNFSMNEGDRVELHGRNGAGKTTIIKALLGQSSAEIYSGEAWLNPNIRVGIYEQEIAETYLDLPLNQAIEQLYLSRDLPISETKIRQLLADYLFTDSDTTAPIRQLSGGQKARFQLIAMLAGDPQLLILDEPTNHLDLPSIEELETALAKYSGAILYISHDNYFRRKIGGCVVQISRS